MCRTLVAPLLLPSLLAPGVVQAHSRFGCPPPRSSRTNIKDYPCGAESGDFTGDPIDVSPGPLTIEIEESIAHSGAPFRISLSGESDDGEQCVLLDHIPADPASNPTYGDERSYHRYLITVEIPDVECSRCSLHLANPMTDKIGDDGAADGDGCTDPGTCWSAYYSCTAPLRIAGATPRSDYACPASAGTPDGWPTSWTSPDDGGAVDAAVPGVYRRESAVWSEGWLLDAPARYRDLAGPLCVNASSTAEDESFGGAARRTSGSKTLTWLVFTLLASGLLF